MGVSRRNVRRLAALLVRCCFRLVLSWAREVLSNRYCIAKDGTLYSIPLLFFLRILSDIAHARVRFAGIAGRFEKNARFIPSYKDSAIARIENFFFKKKLSSS
jgi:hypothetical protein